MNHTLCMLAPVLWWMHVCITDWLLPDKCDGMSLSCVCVLYFVLFYSVLFRCIFFVRCSILYYVTIYLFIYNFMRIPFCWESVKCSCYFYTISYNVHIMFILLMCTLCVVCSALCICLSSSFLLLFRLACEFF